MEAKRPGPTTMAIFGATGDLSRGKLLPALARLSSLALLPEAFNVIGIAGRPLDDAGFRTLIRDAAAGFFSESPIDIDAVERVLNGARYVSSRFDSEDGYRRLVERLDEADRTSKTRCRRIFYLATPPSQFPVIIDLLHRNGLSGKGSPPEEAPRIIIEKPFGSDLSTARALNEMVLERFDEEQVYRIDHYLGKETVQNILFFRFANGVYEPIWNRRYVDHVQITAAESIGVGERGRYFEEAGILRDMVQNHLLQLLSLVAMEPPTNMDPDEIRARKQDLLRAIRPIGMNEAAQTIRGQYSGGVVGGEEVPGYREEPGVAPDSRVETFAALKIFIDNWRWADVPFYLRTGKRLKEKFTEIAIHFKRVPYCLFSKTMSGCPDTNILALRIQPEEGICFRFNVKRPGTSGYMESVSMDFSYRDTFQAELPEAYERLIYDCLIGDSTLFPHKEGIEASWRFVGGILDAWAALPEPTFPNYASGSWGPADADALINMDGRVWRNL